MRPGGWVNPHCNDIEATDYEPGDQFLNTAFEDGADAIIEALMKTGKLCESTSCKGMDGHACISCMEYLTGGRTGILVFIPEDK